MIQLLGAVLGFLAKKFGFAAVKGAITFLVNAFIIATTVSFYLFIIVAINKIFTLIQDFLNLFATSGSGGSATLFGHQMNCSLLEAILTVAKCTGITDAFNASIPLIQIALAFVLFKILYKYTIKSLKIINDAIQDAIRLV